jgi:hypothetical protein
MALVYYTLMTLLLKGHQADSTGSPPFWIPICLRTGVIA